MWLLCAKTQKLHEFIADETPPYAALSHTWGADEVTFEDIKHGQSYPASKEGWDKIAKCCQQAIEDGIEYSSSAELQEAINSMFKWYEKSLECYVFVSDFSHPGPNAEPQEIQSALKRYVRSRWFTRGWTLQELLAPPSVRFFDSAWLEFGDKISLREQIAAATGISQEVLVESVIDVRRALDFISVAQRMSWASRRTTTREEDIAYCLLGIFDVNMPLLYGEGLRAFQRLQEEIMKKSDDQSLLAWGFGREHTTLWSVSTALAQSPLDFSCCGGITSRGAAASGDGFSMSQRGLRLDLPVTGDLYNGDILYCILNCTMGATGSEAAATGLLAVLLARCLSRADGANSKPDEYYWLSNRIPHWVGENELVTSQRMTIYMPCFYRHGDLIRPRLNCSLDIGPLPTDYFIAGMFPPETSKDSLLNLTLHNQTDTSYLIIHIAKKLKQPGYIVIMKCRRHSALQDSAPSSPLYPKDSCLDTNDSKISCTSSLQGLGLDSLTCLRLTSNLRERIGIQFPITIFFQLKTIKDIENKFRVAIRSHLQNHINFKESRSEIPLSQIDNPQFATLQNYQKV
ncbi:heterokaryon incompatibility domain-containing protein [Trichoderma evansii]